MELDGQLAQLYARALVAIARADGEISLEEGLRLQQLVEQRAGEATNIEELLMADRVAPQELAASATGDPFRTRSIHPLELATQLIADALGIALAKGHVTHRELVALRMFTNALGISEDDFTRLAGAHAHHLPR